MSLADKGSLAELFAGIENGSNFYFTHSYQCELGDISDVCATTTHASTFASVVRKDNVFGLQFHPEKSSDLGLKVLKNFVSYAQSRTA